MPLPGIEISGFDGLFHRDHLLALGIQDPFVRKNAKERCPEEVWESPLNPDGTGPLYPENLARWTDYVHRQGGLAVHNHPSGSTRLEYGVDYFEVYNLGQVLASAGYAAAMGYPLDRAGELGLTINNFALYGERDVNRLVRFRGFSEPIPLRYGLWYGTEHIFAPRVGQWLGAPEAPLSSWDDLLRAYVAGQTGRPIFAMANSDAHNTDSLLSPVGLAKNGVYVDDLTEKDFYAALKAGRSFATTGPSLLLEVNGRIMGETAKAARGVARIRLSASSESPDAKIVKIDIYKNGAVWKMLAPGSPDYETVLQDDAVSANGYYRIEITALNPSSGKTTYAWSNPVFVNVR